MDAAIKRLSSYISNLHTQEKKPFYLLVDNQSRCLGSSGFGRHYGFGDPQPGDDLTDKLLFLVGLEESDEPGLKLPFLATGDEISAQVHAIRLKHGWGLAFIDVSEEMRQRLHYQQLAHDLSLLQTEQDKLLEQLRKAHDELENANRLKSQFIGRMSHEFRTPLSSILGFADLAGEDMDDPARLKDDLQAINRSGNYLLNLVDNLLDHAVIENDELIIRPTACDIAELVTNLEQLFQPMARQRGLSLAWWLGPDMPERLWLDELRLRQVLVNLITNAIKYTNSGGITVSLEWEDEQLQASVEDTGPGIPEKDIESLFEPFNQGSGSKNSRRGAGLGLSISREIMQRMGGDLSISSRLGHGTTAHCVVPAGARVNPLESAGDLQNLKIILLEPDEDNRNLLDIYLRGAGCEVIAARDVQDCAQQAAAGNPALLLVSLQDDPDSNRTTTQTIRDQGYRGPVLAIGTREDRDSYQHVLAAGFTDLIWKPIGRKELLRNLADLLQHGSA